MRHLVVGTAGHIDHGKSSLVLALTGIDPDRLEEEKARGITVDLGFAHLERGGVTYGFVDVPGHERFVRNMLAGAAGFDVVLLAVAADESVMPQTREHIEICRLLGVERAVVALTRTDLVDDPELIEIAGLEVSELLSGNAMAGAPILPVSSRTGAGLDRLLAALEEAAATIGSRETDRPFRLPVDRAFTMRGFGTVVTGTLTSGRTAIGEEVEILPGGERARVRGLQVHGEAAAAASAGQRAALNLAGSGRAGGRLRPERGALVAAPGELRATRMLDARLELLDGAAGPLRDEDRVHLHLGAAAVLARARLLGGRKQLPAGESDFVQFRLETPLAAVRGDRYIIRRYSPVITIGGGTVLDASPPKRSPGSRRGRAAVAALEGRDDAAAAIAFAAEAGPRGTSEAELAPRLGLRPAAAAEVVRALEGRCQLVSFGAGEARTLLAAASVSSLEARMLTLLSTWEANHRLRAGMAVEQLREQAGISPAVTGGLLDRLARDGAVERTQDTVESAGRRIELTAAEQRVSDGFVRLLSERGVAPPTLAEAATALRAPLALVSALRRLLEREGRAVAVSPDLYFDAEHLARLRQAVVDHGALGAEAGQKSTPEISVGWFKENFDLSRKYAIPLLEWLDRERVTVRIGNRRRIRAERAGNGA